MIQSPHTFKMLGLAATVTLLFAVAAGHTCIYDKISNTQPPPAVAPQYYKSGYNASIHTRGRMTPLATLSGKMRIKVFFDPGDCTTGTCGHCQVAGQQVPNFVDGELVTCTSDDVLTATRKDYMMNVLMVQAENFLQNALNVEHVEGNLVVGGTRCGSKPGVIVPTADSTTGVKDADFIVYVTAAPLSDRTSSTVAWAFACYKDQNGRPLVGHVNFVPSKLTNGDIRNDVDQREDVATAIHEICHALGFAKPFFQTGYLDLDGVKQTGGTSVETSTILGKQVTKITSPRVVREAQAYFGCSTMNGLEIEDQGGTGTAGSHWEKRLLHQEFMNGISSGVVSYYSRMTLAYFEDTGHYTANYEYADSDMTWGKAKGCDFVNEKCNNVNVKDLGEFCFDAAQGTACTHDRMARGYCNAVQYGSSLPANQQYFVDATIGSSIQVDDFCPSISPYKNRVCIDGTLSSSDAYGETYESGSRCFTANIVKKGFSVSNNPTERCLKFSCSGTGFLRIIVRGTEVDCPWNREAGAADMTPLSGYTGSITCPKAEDLGCIGPGGSDGGTPAPPTPAPPTPVPPATPAPTPAPPGETPQPPAWTPTPTTSAPELASVSCADRAFCAVGLEKKLPFCRSVATQLLHCFGTDCDSEMKNWLRSNGFADHCTDRHTWEPWGAENCVEGMFGGQEICFLNNGGLSAGAVRVVFAMMVVLVAVLAVA